MSRNLFSALLAATLLASGLPARAETVHYLGAYINRTSDDHLCDGAFSAESDDDTVKYCRKASAEYLSAAATSGNSRERSVYIFMAAACEIQTAIGLRGLGDDSAADVARTALDNLLPTINHYQIKNHEKRAEPTAAEKAYIKLFYALVAAFPEVDPRT